MGSKPCNLCKSLISKCDELWVLKIDGWEQSKGVSAEIEYAESLNIPIKYKEYEYKYF